MDNLEPFSPGQQSLLASSNANELTADISSLALHQSSTGGGVGTGLDPGTFEGEISWPDPLLEKPYIDAYGTSTHKELSDGGFHNDGADNITGSQDDLLLADSVAIAQSLTSSDTTAALSEADSVDLGDIYTVLGASSDTVALRFQWTYRDASYDNEIGVFAIDAQAAVDGLRPGDAGYAEAALRSESRQVLFGAGQRAGGWKELQFQGGQQLAFYLIQNSSTEQWLAQNPDNESGKGPVAFFSIDGVNPDKVDHVRGESFGKGISQLSWEDLWGGGDQDYNDAQLVIGPAENLVPGEAGQVAPLTVSKVSGSAKYQSEMGYFLVDDAQGRIGNLKPGDAGYAAAALSAELSTSIFLKGETPQGKQEFSLPSGKYFGWYLVQDASKEEFLQANPGNTPGAAPQVLFSLPGANPDRLSHVHYVAPNRMAWEDQTGGGDLDYDDLVFEFTLGTPGKVLGGPDPSIAINDLQIIEGDDGQGEAVFTVELSEVSDQSVTVDFESVEDTAVAGIDFESIKGQLAFAPGEQKKTLVVPLLWDLEDEDNEAFSVVLTNALNATIADGEGIATIEDNDEPVSTAVISIGDVAVEEGSDGQSEAIFTVSLSEASDQPISVDYETQDGTALSTQDYEAISGTLTFQPGESLTQTIVVPIVADTLPELDEAFTVALSNPQNAALAVETATATIEDDDQIITDNILLEENSDFKVPYEVDLAIPTDPSVLAISFADLNFDGTDLDAIKDAFEVALVDGEGNSLVHTIGPGQTAFFNTTETLEPELAPGITFDGQTVLVNLVGIAPETEAKLIVRLVNNDGDTETSVQITQVGLLPGEDTPPPGLVSSLNAVETFEALDFSQLSDVSASVQPEYGQTTWNEAAQVLTAEISLRNMGNYSVNGPLLVAVENISDPSVQVVNTSGTTPEGLPYFDLSSLLSQPLNPDGVSETGALSFWNPNGGQFTYDLVVFADTNALPVIESSPDLEIIGGQTYAYDMEATDPNGDALTYELVVAPEGMAIDPNTGEITWETTVEDIANHSITLKVSDGRGGSVEQTYTLAVIAEPSNRPPIFTSTPVVDAQINQPYRYDADAIDPDQDPVEYTLVRGPEGLTVDAETGVVEWTPPPILSLGDTVLGQISLPGDQAEFTVNGVVGQRLYLDTLRTFSGFSIEVYDSDGKQIDTGDGLFTLTKNGNYRVVAGGSGAATGSYGFSVIDPALLSEAPLDKQITGQLAPGTEDDVFRFSGVEGQKIFFDQLSKQGTLEWMLFDEGNRIIKQDRSMNDMEMYLPADGEYILVLRGNSDFAEVVEYAFEIVTPDEITAPLVLGSNEFPSEITGEIREPGEEDFFTFVGKKGQRVYLDRLNAIDNGGLNFSLISPTGQDIYKVRDHRGRVLRPTFDSRYEWAPVTLVEDGVYQIRINGDGDAIGDYSFSLRDVGLATSIDLDTAYAGTLNPGEASHLYQFEAQEGEHFFIDYQDNVSDSFQDRTRWVLYDAHNQPVATESSKQFIEVTVDQAGIYTLVIEGDKEATPVEYSFEVITPDTISRPLVLNAPVSQTIGEKGEQDVYTFDAQQGQRVFLDILEASNHRASLVSPSGQRLLDNSWATSEAQQFGGLRNFRLSQGPIVLPEAGEYQLIFDGFEGETGAYEFQVLDVNNAPTIPFETPTSGTLTPGTTIQFYQFEGQAGDRVYLRKTDTSNTLYSRIYGPNNQTIQSASSGGQEFVLEGDGTFYLMVRGESIDAPVEYTIQLDATQLESESMVLDTVVSGTIDEFGEQDTFTFEGTIGQRVVFDRLTGSSDIWASLTSPSGNSIFANQQFSADRKPEFLPEDGTYTLTVDGNQAATGDYSLVLRSVAQPITLGTVVDDTLAAQNTVVYSVAGEIGQNLNFDSLNSLSQVTWQLYAPDNSLVNSSRLNQDFEAVLQEESDYLLILWNSSADAVDYSFQVNDISAAPVAETGLNETYVGTISVQDGVDEFKFTANAGTLIYANGHVAAPGLLTSIVGPDGRTAFRQSNFTNQLPARLPQTGDYSLQVSESQGAIGDYNITLIDVDQSATAIATDTVVSTTLPAQGTAIYKFTGEVGQQLLLDGLNASGTNIQITLIEPDGSQAILIAQSGRAGARTWIGTDSNSELQRLTRSGEYYVIVQSTGDTEQTAEFRVLDVSNVSKIAPGEEISGDFGSSQRESIFYKFDGEQGQRLFIDRTVGGTRISGRFSNNVYSVYSADGQPILRNQYLINDSEVFELPKDGEYILELSGNSDPENRYTLQVLTTVSSVETIAFNDVIEGSIEQPGQQTVYTFSGQANQRILLDKLQRSSGHGTLSATIKAPDGRILLENNLSRTDKEAITLKQDGIYQVIVDGIEDDLGTYQFRLLDFAEATPIELDTLLTGDLGELPDSTQLYRFTGESDQRIYFDRKEGVNSNRYVLYRPDGQTIFDSRLSDDQNIVLPTQGEYIVAIVGNGSDNSAFDLNLVTPDEVTEVYSLGTTVSTAISEPGEVDVYTFAGEAGQIIWLDSLESTQNIFGTLRTPSNHPFGLSNHNINSTTAAVVLPESGTYSFSIYGSGDTTSEYSFRLLDLNQSTPLVLDQKVSGELASDGLEVGAYRLVPDVNSPIYINLDKTGGNVTVYLLDRGGNQLASSFGDLEYSDTFLEAGQEYFLVISGRGPQTANYDVEVVTPEFLTTTLEFDQPVVGEISESGEQDWYTFSGEVGQQLYLDGLIAVNSNLSLKIYAPSGEEVFDYPGFGRFSVENSFSLEETGEYRVVVDGVGRTNDGYGFRLLDVENIAEILPGETIAGTLGENGHETDLYRILGNEGVRLYIDPAVGNGANRYSLYHPDGSTLFNSGLSGDADFVLPATGEYLLAVEGNGNADNAYELRLTAPSVDEIPAVFGSLTTGELTERGQQDSYIFEGTTGQRIYLKTLSNIGGLNLRLYDLHGEEVTSLGSSEQLITLTETGDYSLVVDGLPNRRFVTERNIGSYSFVLGEVPQTEELAFGQPVSGNVDMTQPVSLYRFTGEQGSRIQLDLDAEAWTGANWVLYDVGNQVIAEPSVDSPGIDVVLSVTGQYVLAIQQTGDESVAYSFQASNTAVTDVENSGFGVVRQGSIDQGDQVDRYTFTAKAGTQVLFDSLLSSPSNLRWNLVNPDETISIANSYIGSDRQPGDFELKQTGEYTLEVYSVNGQPAGAYGFNLIELPTNAADQSFVSLNFGLVTEGQLTAEQPTQLYSFNAVVGQKIHFNSIQNSNTSFELYMPNGERLSEVTGSRTSNAIHILEQAGVYNLVLKKADNLNAASYKFQLLTASQEGTTDYNRPYSGTLSEPGEKRIYSFTGEAGQTFFYDNRLSTGPSVILYGSQGAAITSESFGRDFELTLPDDGIYQLVLRGSNFSTTDYKFAVFSYDEQTARDSILPGTGEDSTSDGGDSLGSFAVRIAAEDDQGAAAFQDYQIQVLPDPDNDAPVIVSQPTSIHGLNQGLYRYQVNALDPNGDELFYRLIDGPIGSVIDNETGELIWLPTSETIDQSYEFTVEVDDRHGGVDTQTFSVSIYEKLGAISGAIFNDLNANGYQDNTIIKGDNPDIIFSIDRSGSMGTSVIDWADPNVNLQDLDLSRLSPIDLEIASVIALIDQLNAQDRINSSQVAFTVDTDIGVGLSGGAFLDMQPNVPGNQIFVSPLADDNNNGVSDYREALATGNFSYVGPSLLTDIANSLPEERTLNSILMSDGYITNDLGNKIAEANELLENPRFNVTAFAIGLGSNLASMARLAPTAVKVTDPNELIDIFNGLDSRFTTEPLMGGTVYLDLNNNGLLDASEPFQKIKIGDSDLKSAFEFSSLLPGEYTLRQIVPNGYQSTAPESGFFQETITVDGGETKIRLFGNHEIAPALNSDPSFTSLVPTGPLTVDSTFRYDAEATDIDPDQLKYDLTLAPEGMTVDSTTGTVVWQPSYEQIGQNSAILRVRDGQGGFDLQYLELNVTEPNQAPVFTSVFDEENIAQVGKPFQYQATAVDTDGDPITYSLTGDVPAEVSVDPSTGVVSWTPTQEQLGAQEITVVAQDDKGAQDIQTLSLNVVKPQPNREPVITSQARTVARYETPYLYQVTVDDPDNDVLRFSLVDGPEGMTISEGGLVQWQPTVEANGNHTVTVAVDDGQGGEDQQTFTLTVRHQAANVGPSITSEPLTLTNIERPYTYQAEATDPDGDPILWSLTEAPEGMVIDPDSGRLSWQPGLTQVGDHEITLQASDTLGAFSSQTFTVQVRSTNTPPQILSTPPTDIGIEQPYRYRVEAQDPEGDALSYGLGAHPEGMTINGETGELVWTPTAGQVGPQEVEVWVRDSQDGVGRQTYTLVVSRESVNQAPTITSNPGFWADPEGGYRYQIEATDPDGDALTYELLAGPTGMTVGNGGLVSWSPSTAQIGEHRITVAAFDSLGLGATQSYSVTVTAVNQAPVIRSVPVEQATAGTDYSYDVWASDPDGEAISITLTKHPEGMTIDELGRIRWQPDSLALGTTYPIEVVVSDSRGAATTQRYDLVVTTDQTAPQVSLVVSDNNPDLGETVTLRVSASDNVGVDTLTLTVNGDAVALDTQGQATVTLETPGVLNAVAMATDAAGNEGTDSDTIRVINPFDVDAPQVDLISLAGDLEFSTPITGPIDIIGNALDNNLAFYTLSVAVVGSDDFVEIARGNSVVENGVLGQFDPSILQNDSYRLRLRAEDANGLASTIETQVNVEGELKLGNFQLSFTDMPVAGIPIQVTRTYDTLTSNTTDDFGYGWRLEFRDTDLRTSLGRDEQLEEYGIGSKGFSEGDKVYITLPGGKRESFTFKPQRHPLSRLSSLVGNVLFRPGFEAETGSTSTLTVKQVDITRLSNGEFANFGGARYNPANNAYGGFGGYYELTTQEGIVYRINATTGDMDTVTDLNGNVLTFTDAGISSSTGQQVTFERDAQNRITAAIDPEGNRVIYNYDANGDLIAVTDRENNTTKFDYNDERAHYLEEIIDPLGRTGVRSEYDDQGRLERLIDANGEDVVLTYDPDNSIQTVENQLGYKTTYEYDERGNVLTEIDPEGGVTTYEYNDPNNPTLETRMVVKTSDGEQVTEYTYDDDGNVLTETDDLGHVTRYTYDSRGNVLTTTDPTGQTTTNTYDAKGNLTQIDGQASGPLIFEYNNFGLLTTMTDGSGVTSFTYDRYGNVASQIDALGNTTTFTYDPSGNRETETTTRTLADGTIETLVTQMEYDDEGRVVKVTDPMGYVTETIYDAAGNRIEEIDALGRSTKYVYDERGQLIETIYPDATPDDDSDNLRMRTEYDAAGQVIAQIDELGRRTVMVYDKVGRQIATIYPDATPDDTDDNPRTRTEYDIAGRVIAEIDARGNRTEFRHDEVGRVIETILPDETPDDLSDNPRFTTAYDAAGRQLTQTDALGQVNRFFYDDLGRPVGQEYADGTRTRVEYDDAGRVEARIDQNGIRTQYEYDNAGRLKAVIDALGHRTTYGYDEQGNQVTQTDANGNTTHYEYDKLGRRTATELPLGQRSTSEYDAVGNMVSTTDFNGDTKTYTYDERNRLVQKDLPGTKYDETRTYTDNGLRETVTDGRGTTRYNYDEQNRLTERIDPDGRTIAYSYDLVGNRTSVEIPSGTTNYTFDAQNRLKTVTDPDGGVTTYTYNAVGNLERTEFPNGTVETREYDNLNRLEYIENSGPNGIINSFRYTLDDTGNRTAVNEHDGRRVVYEYDDLYRLEAEIIYEPNSAGPNRIIEYVYDNVGNRLSRTDTGEGTTLYTYDDNDQLKTATTDGVVTNYTYDSNGNTTSKTTNGTTVTYTWNADNRLIGADTDGDGTIDVENHYNENGIRVSQTVNGEETRFLIDENRPYAQVLEEYTPGGIIQVSYVHGNDLISQIQEGEVSIYHVDGLGSNQSLSSSNGMKINEFTYDAFGRILAADNNVSNTYLYAGEQQDHNVGLEYLRSRYRAVDTGRFISRDIFDGFLRKPLTLNKYIYANANPVNNIDPNGFAAIGFVSDTNNATLFQSILARIALPNFLEIAIPVGQVVVATTVTALVLDNLNKILNTAVNTIELTNSTFSALSTFQRNFRDFRNSKGFKVPGKHRAEIWGPSEPRVKRPTYNLLTLKLFNVEISALLGGKPGRVFQVKYMIGKNPTPGRGFFLFRYDYMDFRRDPAFFNPHIHIRWGNVNIDHKEL